jgi:hypothetical protein
LTTPTAETRPPRRCCQSEEEVRVRSEDDIQRIRIVVIRIS